MVRTRWMGRVALVLASAGLAVGQSAPTEPMGGERTDRFIQLQEVGRPPQRCKLLKSWTEPDGTKAYQVQAVDTGEMISIFRSRSEQNSVPGGQNNKVVESRIVHWGSASHPPSGTPEAPVNATILGVPTLATVAPN